jgi:hypothetical protein
MLSRHAIALSRPGFRALAFAGLAGAFLCGQPARAETDYTQEAAETYHEAETSIRDFDKEKGEVSVGAGAAAYFDTEAPNSAITIDGRYNYPLARMFGLEGSLATAFSEADDESQTVIPLLADASLRAESPERGDVSLFALAGVGYGAYFGTDELQDGLTFATPLSGGLEWDAGNFSLQPRVTYRPVFGDELGDLEGNADSWSAVLDVGLPML